MNPKDASESCFVADTGDGFDVQHRIVKSGDVVTVVLETNRVVGLVDAEGFLFADVGAQHIHQGTLVQDLTLTIRAKLDAPDAAGLLGTDGTDVKVILHRGSTTGHERPLDFLRGSFGFGPGSGWQTFTLDLNALDVRFPADPCLVQVSASAPCGQVPVARPNEVSFEFTGNIPFGLTFELDWLTLEPKRPPGLAWRPVLLVHGWDGSPDQMTGEGPASLGIKPAWAEGLASRDLGFAAVALDRFGTIHDNADLFRAAVTDLKERFGVERVNVVGYCKGGINARQHARRHDDIDQLIMLATPNAGSFMADQMLISPNAYISTGEDSKRALNSLRELSGPRMASYNRGCQQNLGTAYTSLGVIHVSPEANMWASLGVSGKSLGLNDEFVTVASVNSLPYGKKAETVTSATDPEAQGCASLGIRAHQCLLGYDRIVDQLFPTLALLTPPVGQPSASGGAAKLVRAGAAADTAGPAQDDVTSVVQNLNFDTALVPPEGTSQAHTVVVDRVAAALFLVFVDQAALQLELVSPTGRRIDATTPLTDSSVVHAPLEAGPVFVTGYSVQLPETGDWTLEVTGTGTPTPDTAYLVTALAQLPPGTGVVLTAAVDQEQYVPGDPVTITATVTADGKPVADAIVTAQVGDPDGAIAPSVVLVDDGTGADQVAGDGVYTTVITTTSSGFFNIFVSARSASAFTRQVQLEFLVTPNATRFSGTVSDHGVDLDGDGRFDQLVVEVEVDVAEPATYRVVGTLTDGAGTGIEQLQVERELQAGLQDVSLPFDGRRLFDFGHDGRYVLDDLVLEDAATEIGLAVGTAYTTAVYAHADFQRPPLLLTGNASDHGAHSVNMDRLPFEELVVAVEVDSVTNIDVEATANLQAEDGSLIAAGRALSSLGPGLTMLEFHFSAHSIFRAGKAGTYTLELLSIWGTAAEGTAVTLLNPDVVAVTQAYQLEDFAESPRFTVSGTVRGLLGRGLVLELVTEGPAGTPPSTLNRVFGDGPFVFSFPSLVSGNSYEVRVNAEPTDPIQVCAVNNASGTIEGTNVINVEVVCV